MTNKEYLAILLSRVKTVYIRDYLKQSEEFDLTEPDFRRLSKIISAYLDAMLHYNDPKRNEWGVDVKRTTLRDMYEGSYYIPESLDERRFKTLSKICYFLGFEHWDDFKLDPNKFFASEGTSETENQIFEIYSKAKQLEFDIYASTSSMDAFNRLHEYFAINTIGGSAESDISSMFFHYVFRHGFRLDLSNEPSYYKIYKMKVLGFKGNIALLKTNEIWELNWKRDSKKRAEHYYLRRGNFLHVLSYENKTWKIKYTREAPSGPIEDYLSITLK